MPKLYDIDRPRAVHVGSLVVAAQGTAPFHTLLCDGTVYNISQYPALGAKLGSLYGGNGTTTFAVPDYRGRVVVGVGTGTGLSNSYVLGTAVGEETHLLSEAEMPAHYHTGTSSYDPGHTHGLDSCYYSDNGAGSGSAGDPDLNSVYTAYTDSFGDHAHTVYVSPTGSGTPHANVAPSQPAFIAIVY